MRRQLLVMLCLPWVSTSISSAEDLAKDTALAEAGDYDAMLRVGHAYLTDQDEGNNVDGIKWLEMSTSGGNVEAYLILGLVYQEGISVQKDAGKAVTNLTLAAELGEPRAMSRLAGIYFKGDLAPQNDVLAVKWAVCAAELGNKSVLKNLEQLNKDVEARSKVLGKQAAEAWLKRRFPKSKP